MSDTGAMKLTRNTPPRSFGRWLMIVSVIAVLVGEVIAWEVSNALGIRNNPLVVGVLSVGLVAAIASLLFDGADLG